MHAPYVCDRVKQHNMVHGCMVYTGHTKTATVSCGTSQVTSEHHIKMAPLMLLLLTETATEEQTNTSMQRHHPMCHSRPQIVQENLDLRFKMHHNQHRPWRGYRKILNGKGLLSQLQSVNSDFTLNLKLTRLLTCGIQWDLMQCMLHCWYTYIYI